MRRPTINPDEHPRPQVMVPMSLFGNLLFSRDYSRVGRFVHMWTHCVWKRDPTYRPFTEDNNDEVLTLALSTGFVVRSRGGKLRTTGPSRDPRWLLNAKKAWWTYAIEAVGQDLVKVGKSIDVARRFEELQCASPHHLDLVGSVKGDIERRLHHDLRPHWTSGEWFRLNDESRAVLTRARLIEGSQ